MKLQQNALYRSGPAAGDDVSDPAGLSAWSKASHGSSRGLLSNVRHRTRMADAMPLADDEIIITQRSDPPHVLPRRSNGSRGHCCLEPSASEQTPPSTSAERLRERLKQREQQSKDSDTAELRTIRYRRLIDTLEKIVLARNL